jgi:hypothetical protein
MLVSRRKGTAKNITADDSFVLDCPSKSQGTKVSFSTLKKQNEHSSPYTLTFDSKKTLTMNLHFSSTTCPAPCPAIIEMDEACSPTVVSQKVRDQFSRSEERVAPLGVGTKKRSRQDDASSECDGRSKIARSNLTLLQRSNTKKSL